MRREKHTGFAIALAWPDTYCKQPGTWYDPLIRILGINKNGFYKAGHAAIVLIKNDGGKCHYFDFGRYHAPFQHGRVRSAHTDPELKLSTRAVVNNTTISNLQEILKEIASIEACHGTGDLHASFCSINFDTAINKALSLQKISPIPYGPFKINGTNCSRFVWAVLMAGRPRLSFWLKLLIPYTISPSPVSNVWALGNRTVIATADKTHIPSYVKTNSVLPAPARPLHLPESVQWLSGEGAGSWFHLNKDSEQFIITRYTEDGNIEFKAAFELSGNNDFEITQSFQVVHLSHYLNVNILQSGVRYKFRPVNYAEKV